MSMNRPARIGMNVWTTATSLVVTSEAERAPEHGLAEARYRDTIAIGDALTEAILAERIAECDRIAWLLLKCAKVYEAGPGARNRGAASALRQFADDLIQSQPVPTVPQLLRKAGARVDD